MQIMEVSLRDVDLEGFLQAVSDNHSWDPVKPHWDART